MNSVEYIWQLPHWPRWRFDRARLGQPLAATHRAQGQLAGRLADFALALREEASVRALTDDVVTSSAIEGETLDVESVRSSVARQLGIDSAALPVVDRHVEGVVSMVLDATRNYAQPLSAARLCAWQAALFPTGRSGLQEILAGQYRNDAKGPMQVVSGRYGRERVHYQAPPASRVDAEMAAFIEWFESVDGEDPLLRAGLAHLWFVTVHPFDDGNGRVARALSDMALARAEQSALRYYSLSAEILRQRREYYDILERTQKGDLDVTEWLSWFLDAVQGAIASADATVSLVLRRAKFWQSLAGKSLNARQVKVLNALIDGSLEGALNNRKWAKRAGCSSDTALRDLRQLVDLGVLRVSEAGGRSTAYEWAVEL